MTDAVGTVVFAAIGLAVGSFLNVCIHRLPRGRSIVWPSSRCAACDRPLAWYENIPLVSYAALRGRCRTCHARIALRYPIVEAVTAAAFAVDYLAIGWTPLLAVRLLFAAMLIVLFAIDLEHQILPNEITLSGVVVGFALSFLLPPGWKSSLLGLVVGGVFPFLIAEIYFRVRGREGMGMGDFKMLAMVGAFLGWPLVWVALIISCVLGTVIGGGALLLSRRGLGTRIPFGTFIAAAALLCAYAEAPVLRLYGQAIRAYLTWVGLAS